MNSLARIITGAVAAGLLAQQAGGMPVHDLGQGLSYYRVHELPADIPSPPLGSPGPCILDLRYAKADEPDAAALRAWVRFNVSSHSPVFILENAETAQSLLAALPGNGPAGMVVLAPAAAKLAADIAVVVAPDVDRKAYTAVEKGMDPKALLNDYPDKPRVDEAYLEKEHIPDSEAPDVPNDKPLAERPAVDFMMQRAVQLYRGLLALKKV